MCGELLAARHSHVASLSERSADVHLPGLLSAVHRAGRRCSAAVGPSPSESSAPDDFAFTQAQWDDLAIPVDLVFFFQQSDLDEPLGPRRIVACYPSPAGATESELDLAVWAEIAAENPSLADVEPDVEAVLVRRRGDGEFGCLIVPIDACYELVGLVRQYWSGFQGGDRGLAPHRRVLRAVSISRARSAPFRRWALRWPQFEFGCTGAEPDRPPAAPTVSLRLHITETTGVTVHALALRTQIRIEPHCAGATTTPRPRRCRTCSASGRGGATRSSRCSSGSSTRWCRRFTGSTDIDVAAAVQLRLRRRREQVPLRARGRRDPAAAVVQRHGLHRRGQWVLGRRSCRGIAKPSFRLPVSTWKDVMELHFPGTAWLRCGTRRFDALHRYRTDAADELGRRHRTAAEGGRRMTTTTQPLDVDPSSSPMPFCSRVTCCIPYRADDPKNQVRWQFGVLAPPGFVAIDPSERCFLQTDCLIEGAAVQVTVRVAVPARPASRRRGRDRRRVRAVRIARRRRCHLPRLGRGGRPRDRTTRSTSRPARLPQLGPPTGARRR